jgi:hypothetical protein
MHIYETLTSENNQPFLRMLASGRSLSGTLEELAVR